MKKLLILTILTLSLLTACTSVSMVEEPGDSFAEMSWEDEATVVAVAPSISESVLTYSSNAVSLSPSYPSIPPMDEILSIIPENHKIESTLLDEKPFSNTWIMRYWDYKPHLTRSYEEFQYFLENVCRPTGDENGEYASMVANDNSRHQKGSELLFEEYDDEFFSRNAIIVLPISSGGKLRFDGVAAEGKECVIHFTRISNYGVMISEALPPKLVVIQLKKSDVKDINSIRVSENIYSVKDESYSVQ
jgi:hypothetical protein